MVGQREVEGVHLDFEAAGIGMADLLLRATILTIRMLADTAIATVSACSD